MELLAQGATVLSVLEHLKTKRIPSAISKYFWCSPDLDFKFRMMPSSGGYYDQRYRDMIEFTIIENQLRDILRRKGVN